MAVLAYYKSRTPSILEGSDGDREHSGKEQQLVRKTRLCRRKLMVCSKNYLMWNRNLSKRLSKLLSWRCFSFDQSTKVISTLTTYSRST